jgi:hypothetical protein
MTTSPQGSRAVTVMLKATPDITLAGALMLKWLMCVG